MSDDRLIKILKNIEKAKDRNYGAIHIMDQNTIEDVPKTSTGILSLDLACGGGYPHGRLIEVYGENGSGKTTLMLQAIAEAQRRGGLCAFLDLEYSLDLSYAQKLGVDAAKMLLSQPDCGEQAFDIASGLCDQFQAGDLIIIDSVTAMKPKDLIEGTYENLSEAPGMHARFMSRGLTPLVKAASKSGVIIMFTNQLRSKIGVMYGPTTDTTGGNALKFFTSQRFEIKRRAQIKVGDQIVGNEVEITVVKNKVAPPYKKASTCNIFGEGISPSVDILTTALADGLVKKAGSWISYNDTQLGQGFTKAAEFLKENPAVLGQLKTHVLQLHGF
jgi:recombination protein RecA